MGYQKLTPIVATGSSAPRYIGDRFGDIVNLKDYGAVGDGVTDDSAAWTAWQAALQSGGLGFIPAGSYLVDGDVLSYANGNILGYVHNTGGETISGEKFFTDNILIKSSNYKSFHCVADHWEYGVTPTSFSSHHIAVLQDKNYNVVALAEGQADGASTALNMYLKHLYANIDMALQLHIWGGSEGPFHKSFHPTTTGDVILGSSSHRFKALYATDGTINTSDEREKSLINNIPDSVLDAWGDVDFLQFKFNKAIEEKGEAARLHSGLIAQHIEAAFKSHGLDASQYGLFCWDSWEEVPEERDIDGRITRNALPAGEMFSLRYEEALCMEAAYQRRRADRLEARLADLEERVNQLTNNTNN